MKKILSLILALSLLLALGTCAFAEAAPEAGVKESIVPLLLENLINILTAVVLGLISVGGTWLTMKLGKIKELEAVNGAVQAVIDAAMLTAAELQQLAVDNLKASYADGKLTQDDINWLNQQLLERTKAKLCVHVYDLINAAGADIEEIILGAAEAWVQQLHAGKS